MKVLVLEDDELVAHGLIRGLGYLGHQGVHHRCIEQAQAYVRCSPDLDVAVIDLGLDDGESGEDFAAWLGRERPRIKRVLISGLARPVDFVEDPPHQLFLRKPFGQPELAALMETLQPLGAKGGET